MQFASPASHPKSQVEAEAEVEVEVEVDHRGRGRGRYRGRPALCLAFALLAVACQKTAAEPDAHQSSPAATSRTESANALPTPSSDGPHCVKPLAEHPPPPPKPAASCPKDPEAALPLPSVHVTFPDTGAAVDAELAQTEAETSRGLMYRTELADSRGMLFFLRDRDEHAFWMHNTCVPLDMIFIDRDKTIVGIVESAAPLTEDARTVGCPSVYVLEVNAGWSRQHGVKPGGKVSFAN